MARRSPPSLNAVVRNKTSVRKDLPNFRPRQSLPRFHLATTLSPNAAGALEIGFAWAARGGSPDAHIITQGKHGIRGEPFPEDTALREAAIAQVRQYDIGSPQWEFYDSLVKHANSSILRKQLDDAELT